jgi:hypothetical protein
MEYGVLQKQHLTADHKKGEIQDMNAHQAAADENPFTTAGFSAFAQRLCALNNGSPASAMVEFDVRLRLFQQMFAASAAAMAAASATTTSSTPLPQNWGFGGGIGCGNANGFHQLFAFLNSAAAHTAAANGRGAGGNGRSPQGIEDGGGGGELFANKNFVAEAKRLFGSPHRMPVNNNPYSSASEPENPILEYNSLGLATNDTGLSGRLLVGCLFAFGSWGIYFERID